MSRQMRAIATATATSFRFMDKLHGNKKSIETVILAKQRLFNV